ncbi:flagellar type III secretion system pore protein FliP [Marinicauda algicola]|uniref:Flagellar biosynthetic protein FliP n=1 Tax=Marinicauda algicola TaxID=2029849 RepID=A0A4V3RYD6_9PROT|nr:flagellar type III secretion system pore protein FliP [Marinicauda algicola]TGY90009.1 flagellar type III secretion system pore protein FliP [Marinicauda algicola]
MTWRRALPLALSGLAAAALFALGAPAGAQEVSIDFGEPGTLTERVLQLIALITVLSLAPSILIMTTSFIRIVVVLSLLRTAIGLQQSPPNAVLISLALFLTAFIMAPVFTQSYSQGIEPLLNGEITTEEAFTETTQPVKMFMLAHTREDDLELFFGIAQVEPESPEATPLHVVAPAFMISELRRAFEIGFLLFIPFLIIDLVVASILMSMGMMMLPPIVISLPFKLIFFVLVDGWRLVTGSLVQSFQTGVPGG